MFFGPSYKKALSNCGKFCEYDIVCTNPRVNAGIFLGGWNCEIEKFATIQNATVSFCVETGIEEPKTKNRISAGNEKVIDSGKAKREEMNYGFPIDSGYYLDYPPGYTLIIQPPTTQEPITIVKYDNRIKWILISTQTAMGVLLVAIIIWLVPYVMRKPTYIVVENIHKD